MFCTNCGTERKEGTLICGQCGVRDEIQIEAISEEASTQTEVVTESKIVDGNEGDWVKIPEGATAEEILEVSDRYQLEGNENPNKGGSSTQHTEKSAADAKSPVLVETQSANSSTNSVQGMATNQVVNNLNRTDLDNRTEFVQPTNFGQGINNPQGTPPLGRSLTFKESTQNLKGRKMVFVVGVLMIIFGGMSVLSNLSSLGSASMVSSSYWELGIFPPNWYDQTIILISLGTGAVQLTAGIMGVVYSRKPEKASLLVIFSIILLGLSVIPVIPSIMVEPLLGVLYIFAALFLAILPTLLLIGSLSLKKNEMKR